MIYDGVKTSELTSLSRSELLDPFIDDIGGGEGYDPDAHAAQSRRTNLGSVTPEEADRVVTTGDELLDALSDLNGQGAADDRVQIYLDTEEMTLVEETDIPVGEYVTLAGGRGTDRPTCEIEADKPNPLFKLARGARLTGFSVQGDEPEYFQPAEKLREMGLTDEEIEAIGGRFIYRIGVSVGAKVMAEDVEIDNMEMGGFTHAAIAIDIPSAPVGRAAESTYIHNCNLTDCPAESLGYGVIVRRGGPFIHQCFFDNNRHAIASTGYATSSWVASRSVFGPNHNSHVLDMHGWSQNSDKGYDLSTLPRFSDHTDALKGRDMAGGEVIVRSCTVCDPNATSLRVRGIPIKGVEISHLQTFNTATPTGKGGIGTPYFVQTGNVPVEVGGLRVTNLFQGRDEAALAIGAPLDEYVGEDKGKQKPAPEPTPKPTPEEPEEPADNVELTRRVNSIETDVSDLRERVEQIQQGGGNS